MDFPENSHLLSNEKYGGTVQLLVSSLTGLDLTKQEIMLVFVSSKACKFFPRVKILNPIGQTGDQLYLQ